MLFSHNAKAQEPGQPQGFRQYKRVHQSALSKIVTGKAEQAASDLEEILSAVPEDAESSYMLAVAKAQLGKLDEARAAVAKALESGLPRERFLGGTKTGLESLLASEPLKGMRAEARHRPVHGPMLGCIQGSSVKIWLRTVDSASVRAIVWPPNRLQDAVRTKVLSSDESTDFTMEIPVEGLRPQR